MARKRSSSANTSSSQQDFEWHTESIAEAIRACREHDYSSSLKSSVNGAINNIFQHVTEIEDCICKVLANSVGSEDELQLICNTLRKEVLDMVEQLPRVGTLVKRIKEGAVKKS